MTRKPAHHGLTILEVLVALVVLGIAVAVLSIMTVSSVQQNVTAGGRTQAAQLLNYLGRLAAGGDETLLGADLEWGYGALPATFRELTAESGVADPALYRAAIEDLGEIGIGAASMSHYRISVCWQAPTGESCIRGDTAGPQPGAIGGGGALPGIN